jgi:hypothetical protein
LKKEAINQAISEMAEKVAGTEAESVEEIIEDDNLSQDEDKLSINENFVDEAKSDEEASETAMTEEELETEIRALNRHVFGINENTISTYQKDTPWSKYTANGELTLKLNLKILIKTYLLNQGSLEECEKITLTSILDFEDPKIKSILEGLNNPTGNLGKITALEKNLVLLNSQILKNTNQIVSVSKDKMVKPLLNSIQAAQAKITREITVLKETNPEPANMVSIKNLQDIVEELSHSLENKCLERSKAFISKYPFGYDLTLGKLVKKESDLGKEEIQLCLRAAISYSDPIVAMTVLDILGINLKNPNTGKLMSEFAKNVAFPLSTVDAEARIRQKGQFSRVVESWDLILKNLINPGMINATSLLEQSRIAFYSLKDVSAERLPTGIKIKSLGMLFMAGTQNYPKNGHVLEKIFELRPQIPSRNNASYEPWPKNKFNWTNVMKNWAKDVIPLGKPAYFVDINAPHDIMSTATSQKEFAYNAENGTFYKNSTQKLNSDRTDNNTKNGNTGYSGLSVWDICNRNKSH